MYVFAFVCKLNFAGIHEPEPRRSATTVSTLTENHVYKYQAMRILLWLRECLIVQLCIGPTVGLRSSSTTMIASRTTATRIIHVINVINHTT